MLLTVAHLALFLGHVPKVDRARNHKGPHAKRRRGWLKNNNPPGDPSKAPRCGAKTRKGTPCQAPAMHNGRCRMHGGLSTGPRTPEGLERCRRANWKTGKYSAEAKRGRRVMRTAIRFLYALGIYKSDPPSRMRTPTLPELDELKAWHSEDDS